MTEQELAKFWEGINKRESALDAECRHIQREGPFPKHAMERAGFLRMSGHTGKTRVVIEYNNDTGEGWCRITSEDPESIATRQYRTEHHPEWDSSPSGRNWCAE